MNKKLRILMLVLAVALMVSAMLIFGACDTIEPPDDGSGGNNIDNPSGALVLSKAGGVYSEAFKLTVGKKNGANKVYYTIDSSEPTKSSAQFPEDGLELKSDMSSSYPLGAQVEGLEGARKYNMLHSTTVRLIETDQDDKTIAVKTASYLITTDAAFTAVPAVFLTVPTVTTAADNVKFIGPRDTSNKNNVYNMYPPWQSTPNYSKVRPSCWGNIEYYDTNGGSFACQTKIKVGGMGSAQNSLRTLNINFNKDAGGNKNARVKLDVFNGADKNDGTGKLTNFSRFKLHDGGSNYTRAGLSSIFVDTIVEKMNTTAGFGKYGTPCHTFINGEYWGAYYTREHLSDVFFADNYSVNKDNVIYMDKGRAEEEGPPPEKITIGDKVYNSYGFSIGDAVDTETAWQLFNELHASDLYNGNLANDALYDRFCEMVDVTSLADTMLIHGFIGNWDYGDNNVRLWRTEKIEKNNPYADGKWRFIAHDTDYCFEPSFNLDRRVSGSDSYGNYTELDRFVNVMGGRAHKDYYLYQAPMQNKRFRALLLERAQYICEAFRQNAQSVYTSLTDSNFDKAYAKQAERWGIANLTTLKTTMKAKADMAVAQGTSTNASYYYKVVQNTVNRCGGV